MNVPMPPTDESERGREEVLMYVDGAMRALETADCAEDPSVLEAHASLCTARELLTAVLSQSSSREQTVIEAARLLRGNIREEDFRTDDGGYSLFVLRVHGRGTSPEASLLAKFDAAVAALPEHGEDSKEFNAAALPDGSPQDETAFRDLFEVFMTIGETDIAADLAMADWSQEHPAIYERLAGERRVHVDGSPPPPLARALTNANGGNEPAEPSVPEREEVH